LTPSIASSKISFEMQQALSDGGQAVWIAAQTQARALGGREVGSDHLLLALTGTEAAVARRALRDVGIDHESVRDAIVQTSETDATPSEEQVRLGADMKAIFSTVMRQAPTLGPRRVEPQHFLLALTAHPESVGMRIFVARGVSRDAVVKALTLQLESPDADEA
jgi:ATP-dependent Clp protease ATP-binding subunit ClpC